MAWNYRAVQFGSGDEAELVICRVGYSEAGEPVSYIYNAMATGSTFMELRDELHKMLEALGKPRLRATDFPDAPRNGVN